MDKDAEFVVYTTNTCPFCDAAKLYLKHHKKSFKEVSVIDSNERAKIVEKSGMRTVPVVYHGDTLVGGFTDLKNYIGK